MRRRFLVLIGLTMAILVDNPRRFLAFVPKKV